MDQNVCPSRGLIASACSDLRRPGSSDKIKDNAERNPECSELKCKSAGTAKCKMDKTKSKGLRKFKPKLSPKTTTLLHKSKSLAFKRKPSAAISKANCVSRKRKVRIGIKEMKSRKETNNTYLSFLCDFKSRNGLIPEREIVQRAVLAWCHMSKKMKRKYQEQVRRKIRSSKKKVAVQIE